LKTNKKNNKAHEHTAKTMLQIVRKQGGIYIKVEFFDNWNYWITIFL